MECLSADRVSSIGTELWVSTLNKRPGIDCPCIMSEPMVDKLTS